MVRIPSNPLGAREDTLQDLRNEFLVRCHAKNLSPRTIEWYAKHSELFIEWCRDRGVTAPAQLSTTLLEECLIDARAAGIEGVRCSPHTLRHTGAKRFILAGGDMFTLQKLLGHTTLYMVRRYVEMASVDVQAQHERFSPADSLLRARPSG